MFDPPLGKIPWRRKEQPIPLFLPEKPHGQRSAEGYSPKGHKVAHDGTDEHACNAHECAVFVQAEIKYPKKI